ncbi:hypothetical protein HYDPIDRAFT_34399 [Hydnomerulius pinastri MD-312]|uniref:SAP domain-containing protein n=1 Tax=Hydnomerulius pinastri MD-312 TaxID=994086 RepID=A0A0C9UYX3_9AGAM|nr:hypothetical protein HYDPIDRAFT_34399 [Hydnomerulius pinastri MD-312]
MSSTTEISEKEKIKFLEDAVEALKDKGNVEKFTEAIKVIGRAAVYTDEAFDKINRTLLKFVEESGSDFPEIKGYQTRWAGYQTVRPSSCDSLVCGQFKLDIIPNQTWQKNLKDSRDLANVASADYQRYNKIFLEIVDRIKTASDIPEAAEALKGFSEETPPPTLGLSEKFQTLQRDVAEFKTDFDEYVKNKGVKLKKEAEELAEKIDGLEKDIVDLDKKIKDATIALAVTTPFFWIGGIVAGSMLAKYNSERKGILTDDPSAFAPDKQADLDKAKTDLEDVNRKQKALAHIKSEFDGLTPSFTIISLSLGIFADTWASFHGQALQFSSTLSKLQDPQKIPVPLPSSPWARTADARSPLLISESADPTTVAAPIPSPLSSANVTALIPPLLSSAIAGVSAALICLACYGLYKKFLPSFSSLVLSVCAFLCPPRRGLHSRRESFFCIDSSNIELQAAIENASAETRSSMEPQTSATSGDSHATGGGLHLLQEHESTLPFPMRKVDQNGEPEVEYIDIDIMTVKELKVRCRNFGLFSTGTKQVLFERLRTFSHIPDIPI